MSDIRLEHVNISVKNAQKTALDLCTLFDWHIRWEGSAGSGAGYTYHVGNDVISSCIDISFVENLFWKVSTRKAQPYWTALPSVFKELYVQFHTSSPV